MTKANKKFELDLPDPTEEEIRQTRKKIEEDFDTVIPGPDLVRIVQLTKELNWWIEADKGSGCPKRVTEEMAIEFKELLKKVRGIDIPLSEAYDEARSLLTIAPVTEKMRLSAEIRAIIVTHRPIERFTAIEDKTLKIFKMQYGLTLSEDRLVQVVSYLTRMFWYKEGLSESLETCLDDLLLFADKQKRGKRTNGIDSHDDMRKAMDEIMGRLNIPSSNWERLYKENK